MIVGARNIRHYICLSKAGSIRSESELSLFTTKILSSHELVYKIDEIFNIQLISVLIECVMGIMGFM